MDAVCYSCDQPLSVDIEEGRSEIDTRITTVMNCCKAMMHENCILESMRKQKQLNEKPACPKCNEVITDEDLIRKITTTAEIVKRFLPIGTAVAGAGLFALAFFNRN
jgi:transcription elongation factor Elf1